MEPISLTLASLAMVFGDSIIHFLVHKGGDKTISIFLDKIQKTRIKNHDVDEAIQDAFNYTILKLEKECLDDEIANKIIIEEEFSKLKKLYRLLEYNSTRSPEKDALAITFKDLYHHENPSQVLVIGIIEKAGIENPAIKGFLVSRFYDLFLFAFKEIGLKCRPKVNTVLTHEILHEISHTEEKNSLVLQQMSNDMISLINSVGAISVNESMVKDKLMSFESKLDKLQNNSLNLRTFSVTGGEVKIILLLYFKNTLIGIYPSNLPIVTIGRAIDNLIILPDMSSTKFSSRYHAEILFKNDKIILKDISRNGTVLRDHKVHKDCIEIRDGDDIIIGTFSLSLTSDIKSISMNVAGVTGTF